jgi:hypothetical protein
MINQWLQYVNEHNVEKVVSLYAEDATLWGTFSENRRDGTHLIREYFTHFLSLDSLQAVITQITTRILGNAKIYSGQYTFRYQENNTAKQVKARFTFVTGIHNNTERILEHHSSVIPKS